MHSLLQRHAVLEYTRGTCWLTPCWANPVAPELACLAQGLLWGQATVGFWPGRVGHTGLMSWAARPDSAHGAGFEFQFLFNSGNSLNLV
jgi:hypothetical protein